MILTPPCVNTTISSVNVTDTSCTPNNRVLHNNGEDHLNRSSCCWSQTADIRSEALNRGHPGVVGDVQQLVEASRWHNQQFQYNGNRADARTQISTGSARITKVTCTKFKEKKLPQLVEKRNARERRRVQAVNNAFLRLRKAIPVEHARGKRISKVKTLKNAIEYINALEDLLKFDRVYYDMSMNMYNYQFQRTEQAY